MPGINTAVKRVCQESQNKSYNLRIYPWIKATDKKEVLEISQGWSGLQGKPEVWGKAEAELTSGNAFRPRSRILPTSCGLQAEARQELNSCHRFPGNISYIPIWFHPPSRKVQWYQSSPLGQKMITKHPRTRAIISSTRSNYISPPLGAALGLTVVCCRLSCSL